MINVSCYTGHFMDKSPGSKITCALVVSNPNKVTLAEQDVRLYLSYVIVDSFVEGINSFIVTLNSDIQMKAAEEIIQLRDRYPDEISFYAIESHEREFPKSSDTKKQYKRILRKADGIIKIPVHCSKRANDACNEWLMAHSDSIIPIYTGDKVLYKHMVDEVFKRGKGITYCSFFLS